jgi:hypothetical protein
VFVLSILLVSYAKSSLLFNILATEEHNLQKIYTSLNMKGAYTAEELLALRDSVSESAVSLDKFRDEEAIKGEYLTTMSKSAS